MTTSASDLIEPLVAALPFPSGEELKIVCLGEKDGPLARALAARFPRATLKPVDRDVAALDWWDVMFGADAVVSSMTLHGLNDARKQYLYKAAAERLSPRGVFLAADRLQPQQLLHHLVWLKHAGFPFVDCFWLRDAHAVFGGFKQASASAPPPPADN